MTSVLLGLSVAMCFGAGDFVGGLASVRASTLAVLFVAQSVSSIGALALAVTVSGHATSADLAYGATAGVVNVIGLGLLYDALARHAAAVVAPTTAFVGATVPIAWGLLRGERPSVVTVIGVVMAVAAGVLIVREPGAGADRQIARGVVPAVLAGLALGSSLVLYAETSHTSGQWPVAAARLAATGAVGLVLLVVLSRGPVHAPTGAPLGLAAGAGVLDVTATALLVVAVRRALLVVVAPVASLAPAFTVLLSALVLGQPIQRGQRVGLAGALAGLVLIAAG